MNKISRFNAAVQGDPVDRPPVTSWIHFQSDHLSAHEVAQLHLRFLEAFDWDVLKVMNDFRYPVPAGVEDLRHADVFKQYQPLSMDEPSFVTQLECLQEIFSKVGDQVPVLETLFEPCQQIVRNIGFDQSEQMFAYPQEALPALEIVTETMCRYVEEVRKIGVQGIFLSINGAIPAHIARGMTAEQHEHFYKKYTVEVLKAAEGMVRVVHVHGNHLQMERVLDYPCEVFSVSDRLSDNPGLAELRTMTDKCLMGGLDESKITDRSLPALKAEIDDALAQAGRERFILAPGCTIPSFTSKRTLDFLRAYTQTLST
ncbi:MAG TPA: uroporphyrinogen decarboxylase family protein [Paenalcaligenes sp.]|nr:uroporphyrinogen decarboxylase family protein [Paenalcaligenes sp.]